LTYAGMNEKDQAFSWLDVGSQEHSAWMTYVKVEPRFDSLRSDPRFETLLRRINFPA